MFRKYLNENWFKIVLIVIISTSLYFHFFIAIKKHNLDVTNNRRLCAGLNGKAVQDCSDAVKEEYIKW
jgi:hypothetical protein